MSPSTSTPWVLFGLIFIATAAAAPGEDDLRGEGRARTLLVLRIAEDLGLTDDKALAINRLLTAAQARREEIQRKRAALAPEIEKAVAAGENDRIEALVAEARDIDRELLLVVADVFEEIGSALTVAERGKLTLLIPELQRDLRGGDLRRQTGAPRSDSDRTPEPSLEPSAQ